MKPVSYILLTCLFASSCGGNEASTPDITGPETTSSISSQTDSIAEPEIAEPEKAVETAQAAGNALVEINPLEADTTINITIANGKVTASPQSPIEVEKNSTIGIIVESDIPEEVHVHSYDIISEVDQGLNASFSFTANISGQIEVELENSQILLANLQIS